MRRITILIVSILFISDTISQYHPGSCNLERCYPKLTTNSSKLNALLVFGIFEVPLHEKCLMFTQADHCFKSVISSCQGPPKARKFHIDSWENAKKLFDYICEEEYIAFNESQACLKELALSSGIQKCDSYFSFKATGNDICDLPSRLSTCVEHEAKQMCPDEDGFIVPKIVKMVGMFLSHMININTNICSSGQHTTTENPNSHAQFGLENKDGTETVLRQFDEGIAHIQKLNTSDPPIHTFVVTRRNHGSRRTFIPKRRKDDEDDDDDAESDDTGLQRTNNGNQRNSFSTANPKSPDHEVYRHRHQHHHRHHGYLDNNGYRGSDTSEEIDAEDEFGRRHRLKLGQALITSNKEMMASSFILLASSCILTLIL